MIGKNLLGEHTIVAGGEQACDPHMEGEGPLPAHLPIVFDIFPHHESTRYFADMTRTLFKGPVKNVHRELYEAVLEAQKKRSLSQSLKKSPENSIRPLWIHFSLSDIRRGKKWAHGGILSRNRPWRGFGNP